MVRRLYVHNFRCLENFELKLKDLTSALLIGNNGSGKTAVGLALEIFQKIARGVNRVGKLVQPKDSSRGRGEAPMRFELEIQLENDVYVYEIAFELPERFRELRVREENLKFNGQPVYTRDKAEVTLARTGEKEVRFRIDWHLVGLPVIQEQSERDPLFRFKQWLGRMLILRPVPQLIAGESDAETLQPDPEVRTLGAWFSGIVAHSPSIYSIIEQYLKKLMPDLRDVKNPPVGANARSLSVEFASGNEIFTVPFSDLSEGEKSYFIGALVLAAHRLHGPLFCFWDEPDNYLALSEVGHFIHEMRCNFQSGGQFLATSHHPETIRHFTDENTFVLYRKSHLEPTQVRLLQDIQRPKGDLITALTLDEITL